MALPPGVTTCIVTFGSPASGFNGEDVATTLNITPSHSVYHATTGAPLLAFSIQASAGEGLPGSVALPHTDQAGFLDASGNAFTNWAYTAEGTWRSGGATIAFKKNFQLPTGQQTVDLDLIPNGTIGLPVSAPIATVTSVLGKTGAISAEDLGELGVADGSVDEVKLDPAVVTKIDGKLDAVDAADFITETQADASYAPVFPDSIAPTYDSNGNVLTVTTDGVTTTYTYNPDGTVATDERAGVTRTYTYDGSGNLTGIAS